MTSTLTPLEVPSATPGRTRRVGHIGGAGIVAGLGAAVVNLAVVAGARQLDVNVEVGGKAIPLLGFAQMTLLGAVIGIGLAAVFARRSHQPRRTFIATTVVMSALTMVPPVLVDADVSTKLVLALTHVIGAVIVIPALASRLTH